MKKFIKPDWTNSVLNISATFAEFLGVENKNATLKILKDELDKGFKNVIYICFDGMGINPLNKNLSPNNFLMQNIKTKLTSTFPSTTTCATTSLTSNLLPLEHGWLGWTLYFDEIKRNIDIYRGTDSKTKEVVDYKYPLYDNSICYFDNPKSDYNTSIIAPSYVKSHCKNSLTFNTLDEFFKVIKNVCNREGKQFIYAYFPEPDATMHEFGVSSPEANNIICQISKGLQDLKDTTQNTLFTVSADHGQVDVEGYVEFFLDAELNSMLKCAPFLEARAPAFWVKDGMHDEFFEKFTKKYGDDFILYKTKDLIAQNYFGARGDKGNLLGDFIAVGTFTHKQFLPYEDSRRFKGHHTSLTEEMEVPLIMFSN